MASVMHLDYMQHQGRRIPYFRNKQDAEQALLSGAIRGGDEFAISRDSFPSWKAGDKFILSQGLAPISTLIREAESVGGHVAEGFASREASTLAAKQAAERAVAEAAARRAAAEATARASIARTAAERAAAEQVAARHAAETAARKQAEQAAAKHVKPPVKSTAAFVAKGATITAVIGTAGIVGNTVIAKITKQPEAKHETLPNGDILVTYPDGSTATIDAKTGKVKSTSSASGLKGTIGGAGDAFKWVAIAGGVLAIGVIANRSSKSKAATSAAALQAQAPKKGKPKAPATAKPVEA